MNISKYYLTYNIVGLEFQHCQKLSHLRYLLKDLSAKPTKLLAEYF